MMYICPECGSEIPEDEEFCSKCGCLKKKALVTNDKGEIDFSKCPNCGAPVVGDENFCGSCGAPLIKQVPSVMFKMKKHAALAMLLAFIPGLFDIYGLGHLVLKKWSRGFMFLAITFLMYFIGPSLGNWGFFINIGLFMFQFMDIMNYMYERRTN